jgi:flagellar biosynthesis protein FliQ
LTERISIFVFSPSPRIPSPSPLERARGTSHETYKNVVSQKQDKNTMTPNEAIDLVRDAILMSLIVGAPLLVVGMLVGLVIGLIQALTQIQDQTVSTVPKLVAMTLAIIVCLPWLTDRMLDYSRNVLKQLPPHLSER